MHAFLRGFFRGYMFGALICTMLFLLGAFTVRAQPEATPEPVPIVAPAGDVTVEDGGTAVVNTDSPDPLAPLLAMAGSVFAVMEILKQAFLKSITEPLAPRYAALVNWLVASVLAFILVLGAPPGTDIFTASGYPNPGGLLLAQVLTALFVGGGNALLHAAYEFLRTPRLTVNQPLRQ